jgi:hypothetical protein
MATPRRRSAIDAAIARPTPTAAFGRKKICPYPTEAAEKNDEERRGGRGGDGGKHGNLVPREGVSALQRSQKAGT